MTESEQALFTQVKPLRDPVRSFTISLLYLVTGGAATTALISLFVVKLSWLAVFGVVAAVVIQLLLALPIPFGLWLVLNRVLQRKVIYLRAFRSDVSAVRVRRLLAVALGATNRLCGIRAPQRRGSLVIEALAPLVKALRYLNSPLFDLEAEDRDWMARLLASYSGCRFVVIDVRDTTHHVLEEIQLSFKALRAERCIFLVDADTTPEEWRMRLAGMLQLSGSDPSKLRLLVYPGDSEVDEADFVAEAQEMFRKTPDGAASITDEAIRFARARVSPACWRTRLRDTDLGRFLFTFAVSTILGLAGFWLIEKVFVDAILLIFGAVSLAVLYTFYLPAWWRAWRQSRLTKRLLEGKGEQQKGLLLSLAIIISPVVLVAYLMGVRNFVPARYSRESARGEILLLTSGIEYFKTDYGTYPREAGVTEQAIWGAAAPIDPRVDGNPDSEVYKKASKFLYQVLSGDSNCDGQPGDGGARIYCTFKPSMLKFDDSHTTVLYLQDPFGLPYGYSTAGARDEDDYRDAIIARRESPEKATGKPNPRGDHGFNSTFDLWSTGGSKITPATDQIRKKWIGNW